ncbi:hypothetical protein LAZ67_2005437 [Cordylochernes scorpioides]|uniref:DUF5641 domain-containing protein n=1 Tax=Cordylochernes scorpioides TaxID=51811 RepID=A0ABY6K7M0_9ARAC|nr:hypothetical protein LAZ67_2005437 [Cordylochernes scorpioides]
MKQDSTHPHHWPLARIIKTYKGPDGHVRVVDLKTSKNVFKRPITKIAPLPFKEWILFLLDLAVQRGKEFETANGRPTEGGYGDAPAEMRNKERGT